MFVITYTISLDVNIHGNVNEWSVECVVSEMSGECHVRTIDEIQRYAVVDT